MSDYKCPSCGAPMELGVRESGYCEYVAPAPKATEMSAEQKQQMLELKKMLLEQYADFQRETQWRAEIRVLKSMNIGWFRKWITGVKITSCNNALKFGEGLSISINSLELKVIYFEDGDYKLDGTMSRFVSFKNSLSASAESFRKELDEKVAEQKWGSHAPDFPSEREFIEYRMKEIREDQAFFGSGDDIVIQ